MQVASEGWFAEKRKEGRTDGLFPQVSSLSSGESRTLLTWGLGGAAGEEIRRAVCSVGAYGVLRPKAQKVPWRPRVHEGRGLPDVQGAPRRVSLNRLPDGVDLDVYRFGNKRPQTPCL